METARETYIDVHLQRFMYTYISIERIYMETYQYIFIAAAATAAAAAAAALAAEAAAQEKQQQEKQY